MTLERRTHTELAYEHGARARARRLKYPNEFPDHLDALRQKAYTTVEQMRAFVYSYWTENDRIHREENMTMTLSEAIERGPQPGEAYVAITGLTPEEKAHVRHVVSEANAQLDKETP